MIEKFANHHTPRYCINEFQRCGIAFAAEIVRTLGQQVFGPSEVALNSIQSMLVYADGSNEGWDASDVAERKRSQFIMPAKIVFVVHK